MRVPFSVFTSAVTPRLAKPVVLRLAPGLPVLALTESRQSAKTTLAPNFFQEALSNAC